MNFLNFVFLFTKTDDIINPKIPTPMNKVKGTICEFTEAFLKITSFKACMAQASGVNLEIICIYFGASSKEKKEPPSMPVTVTNMAVDIVKFCCFFVNKTNMAVMLVNKSKYAANTRQTANMLFVMLTFSKYFPASKIAIT